MTAAQRAMAQGQPMKAQTGASVNTGGSVGDYMQAIQKLKQEGDKGTLNNIATDKRLPRSVQMAAANALAGIEAQPDEPSRQVPLAPTDKLGSLASGTPVMAVRGSGEQIPSKFFDLDQIKRAAMYPLEIFGMPVPEDASGTPTGTVIGTDSVIVKTPSEGIGSLPSMPDESSGMDIMGEEPKMLPFGMDRLVTGVGEEISKDITEATTGRRPDRVQQEGQRGGEKIGERAAFLQTPEPEAPAAETEAKEDKTPDPVTAAEKIITDPSTLLPQISTTLGDKETTPKQKADATDAALGIKGTRKERVEQRYEMLKDLLGEDKADDIRTDVGYNLMMTGLMIAAGQSPDAMTNIAGGLAKGLAGYGKAAGEAAQAEAKEEKALKLMAAKEVGDEITAETAAEIKARELAEERSFRQRMKDLEIDAAYERANIPSATQRMYEAYLEPEQIKAVLTKTKDGSGPQVMSRERFIADSLNKTASVDSAMADLAAQGIKNPTQSQIAEHLGRVYDGIIAGPSAAASQGSAQTVDVSAHQAANAAAKEAGQSTYIVDSKSYKVQ
jgi:hypothetical protein